LPAKNTTTAKIISGGIRKDLALEIAKKIPPPFECHHITCLFCAGSLDTFFIKPPGDVCFVEKDFLGNTKELFVEIVTKTIKRNGGEVVEIFFNSKETIHKKSFFSIKWDEDITPEKRYKIAYTLKDTLKSDCNLNGRFAICEDSIDRL
jgi:hypothetical protein